MKFSTYKEGFSLPKAEERILEFWDAEKVFEKAHAAAENWPEFVFYEGPPTANGRPGIHHILSRTVKDLVCRYKAMQGFRVDRKAGWDTHGLPVEIEVEKALGLDSKAKVIEYGIDRFNQKCRESVFKYVKEWDQLTRRIGYWLDLDDAYVTLTNDYIESVWWILKTLFDRDLIYKGYKIMPFCPRCGTGLSSHEVAQGYEMIKDPSIFVKVKAADGDFSYLVWTTTPWTLPSNAALCMHPDAYYVMVEHEGEKLVLAEALVHRVFGESPKVLERMTGAEFLKRRYEPLFDIYPDMADQAYFVINGDFVTLDDGTGIVHIAPGFGADDYEVGQQYGLPVLQAIDPNGIFKDNAGKYAGMFIKDADPVITEDLAAAGRLFRKEIYEHSYPFCWRCDSPLIYIARQSWYIKTTLFKEQLIRNNDLINWYPDEIRTGRMQNWLENNVDWALSRERFWGTPLPIWICDEAECGKARAVGSIRQLREEGLDVPDEIDLHKPFIDSVRLRCDCGGTMTRVPELIDVWFDSGSMPYAQWHYPFENEELFRRKYPAEFISEGVDQTRGWFYVLLAISTMLFDQPPFKNVIVFEFILDKEGKKMSKHKGNVVDPFDTVNEYGADPVRWYLVSTSSPWLPTRFDTDGLAEVIRKYFDTLRNTYSFFAIYANIDDVLDGAAAAGLSVEKYLESKAGESDRFDLWIMSRYHSLVKEVAACLDRYEITRPVRLIQHFVIEDLSNWYVRNNRRRFWAKADDPSKMRAYLTLYRVLEGVCRLSAPVSPFISELIWKELHGEDRARFGAPLSVHMAAYPKADESCINAELEETMGLAAKVVSLGRAARSRKNLKVRQPLSRLIVGIPSDKSTARLEDCLDIIRDQLNIKAVETTSGLDQYVSYSARLNFRIAGPRLSQDAKEVGRMVEALNSSDVQRFVQARELKLQLDGGRTVMLKPDEVEVNRNEREGYAVESDGHVTVALATELSEDLVDEGFAREIVNKIQNMRKTSGFEVTDRIRVRVNSTRRLNTAASRYDEFIRRETLAQEMEVTEKDELDGGTEWNVNGEKAVISVEKV
ncbi:MAG TPA: isoleucine--tRNA ligase [Acidobacteriota bacterium]|nr:isoleucine--tRNA ligase [Acidobacteriota bacterium]